MVEKNVRKKPAQVRKKGGPSGYAEGVGGLAEAAGKVRKGKPFWDRKNLRIDSEPRQHPVGVRRI